jgi:hypothetical protein
MGLDPIAMSTNAEALQPKKEGNPLEDPKYGAQPPRQPQRDRAPWPYGQENGQVKSSCVAALAKCLHQGMTQDEIVSYVVKEANASPEANARWRKFFEKVAKKEKPYDTGQVGLQEYLPVQKKRPLSEKEEESVEREQTHWFPRIFESYGMPLQERMASPGKQGLLHALLGGGLGAAIGKGGAGVAHDIFGGDKGTMMAAGIPLGALLGATAMGIPAYFRRRARNEGTREMMSRLPEGATLRDLLSDPAYQRDKTRQHQANLAAMYGGGGLGAATLLKRSNEKDAGIGWKEHGRMLRDSALFGPVAAPYLMYRRGKKGGKKQKEELKAKKDRTEEDERNLAVLEDLDKPRQKKSNESAPQGQPAQASTPAAWVGYPALLQMTKESKGVPKGVLKGPKYKGVPVARPPGVSSRTPWSKPPGYQKTKTRTPWPASRRMVQPGGTVGRATPVKAAPGKPQYTPSANVKVRPKGRSVKPPQYMPSTKPAGKIKPAEPVTTSTGILPSHAAIQQLLSGATGHAGTPSGARLPKTVMQGGVRKPAPIQPSMPTLPWNLLQQLGVRKTPIQTQLPGRAAPAPTILPTVTPAPTAKPKPNTTSIQTRAKASPKPREHRVFRQKKGSYPALVQMVKEGKGVPKGVRKTTSKVRGVPTMATPPKFPTAKSPWQRPSTPKSRGAAKTTPAYPSGRVFPYPGPPRGRGRSGVSPAPGKPLYTPSAGVSIPPGGVTGRGTVGQPQKSLPYTPSARRKVDPKAKQPPAAAAVEPTPKPGPRKAKPQKTKQTKPAPAETQAQPAKRPEPMPPRQKLPPVVRPPVAKAVPTPPPVPPPVTPPKRTMGQKLFTDPVKGFGKAMYEHPVGTTGGLAGTGLGLYGLKKWLWDSYFEQFPERRPMPEGGYSDLQRRRKEHMQPAIGSRLSSGIDPITGASGVRRYSGLPFVSSFYEPSEVLAHNLVAAPGESGYEDIRADLVKRMYAGHIPGGPASIDKLIQDPEQRKAVTSLMMQDEKRRLLDALVHSQLSPEAIAADKPAWAEGITPERMEALRKGLRGHLESQGMEAVTQTPLHPEQVVRLQRARMPAYQSKPEEIKQFIEHVNFNAKRDLNIEAVDALKKTKTGATQYYGLLPVETLANVMKLTGGNPAALTPEQANHMLYNDPGAAKLSENITNAATFKRAAKDAWIAYRQNWIMKPPPAPARPGVAAR